MSKLMVMVGLPGSGKTTFAHKLCKQENAIVLSSDNIREELFGDESDQSNNKHVFEEMNNRAKEYLSDGYNVVYDATNTNRKRRVHLINHELKCDKKVVYYMNDRVLNIALNDSKRDNPVGTNVISRMYKNMQIPVLNEGWDELTYVSDTHKELVKHKTSLEKLIKSNASYYVLFDRLSDLITDFSNIYGLAQDSKYHSFSVSRHTYHVFNQMPKENLRLLWSSLFHDVGKYFCKSFINYKGEETKYANFIGHEYVSSQLAAYYLTKLGYDDKFVQDVVGLVQFHMYPMKASDKKMNEIKRLLGDKLYTELMLLHEADMNAK